ncbi:acylphosphatase [Gaopeijia maritima]|uniref:acylphosphatase n=1 Tax=Gaopeijia maritima TaxID=3119007 RepID=UPI003249839F
MERAAWKVRGRVQGVGFRWSTMQQARALGLSGRVWNCADGSVEVHVRGEVGGLAALEEWLSEGPEAAEVGGLERIEPGPAADESGFAIVRGSVE